jgi:hypothetical protein
MPNFAVTKMTVYDVDAQGNIVPREINDQFPINSNGPRTGQGTLQEQTDRRRKELIGNSFETKADAVNASLTTKLINQQNQQNQRIAELTSQENSRNALAQQIAALTAGGGGPQAPLLNNQAIAALSRAPNYGASELGNKLNFQVSDQQIIDDYNNTKVSKLNSIVSQGNAQIAGIQQRLNAANQLLSQLPSGDARYASSKVYVDQLNNDLKSVTEAVNSASDQVTNFKPISAGSPEAASQITSFREYLQLPEERATQQLRQIDPESYQTAVNLGQKYREMTTAPIGETKSAQTEQLRSNLEQEAINQLALGSQLGAEEQRQYQQAARAAQTARGNIFGVAPAVEEAVTTGAAGEQRKLARYGAATQFLASGQNTSDALKADLAFRDALLQSRLGAASGFIAGGPSLYNLGQARTGAQQSAFQNYVQANQAMPGQFGQAPSTSQPFYQAVDQGIPVNLTNTFANLYGSQANYLANTYGAQVGAISRQQSGAQQAASILGGISGFAGLFGAPGSSAFFRA